jgi:hypothetical protein
MGVIYANEIAPFELIKEPCRKIPMGGWGYRHPGQDTAGYGRKVTSDYKVRFLDGEMGKPVGRKYRVYITCFSNVASHWIKVKGQVYHVDEYRADRVVEDSCADPKSPRIAWRRVDDVLS